MPMKSNNVLKTVINEKCIHPGLSFGNFGVEFCDEKSARNFCYNHTLTCYKSIELYLTLKKQFMNFEISKTKCVHRFKIRNYRKEHYDEFKWKYYLKDEKNDFISIRLYIYYNNLSSDGFQKSNLKLLKR